jgi:hypothetical protein
MRARRAAHASACTQAGERIWHRREQGAQMPHRERDTAGEGRPLLGDAAGGRAQPPTPAYPPAGREPGWRCRGAQRRGAPLPGLPPAGRWHTACCRRLPRGVGVGGEGVGERRVCGQPRQAELPLPPSPHPPFPTASVRPPDPRTAAACPCGCPAAHPPGWPWAAGWGRRRAPAATLPPAAAARSSTSRSGRR